MEFCWSNMTSVLYYPEKIAGHKGSVGKQKCSHCKCDPMELWDPKESHTYRKCNRKGEPIMT